MLLCLAKAVGSDKLVGTGLLLASVTIFVYYTLWVIVLVSGRFLAIDVAVSVAAVHTIYICCCCIAPVDVAVDVDVSLGLVDVAVDVGRVGVAADVDVSIVLGLAFCLFQAPGSAL